MTMSLWDLIQRYVDETGATEASIQRRAGLGKGTFTAWRARGIPALPLHGQLLGLAEALRVDYATVVEAVLHDTNYLPKAAAQSERERYDRAHGAQLRAASMLHDAEGDVQRARRDVRSALLDGTLEPDLADAVDDVLTGADSDLALAAHDEEHTIESEQQDDFP